MGATESALSPRTLHAQAERDVKALERRFGGHAGEDHYDPSEDDYDPRKPEFTMPSGDDYDPRKPEYIVPSTAEQNEDRAVLQLQKQMVRLRAALSKRRLDPTSHVNKHYERVLRDMQLAVDAATQRRLSRTGQPSEERLLSVCRGSLTTWLAMGNEVMALLDNEQFEPVAGCSPPADSWPPALPRPDCRAMPLTPLKGDEPASLPMEEGRLPAVQQVRYQWVQSCPAVSQSRIVETRSMPTRTFCTIVHAPVDVTTPYYVRCGL
mmetsp:Transcript_100456/g.313069  ORF Transcript_100456/g.313069 Transcript_100456/m.313069 type:complete len:265 (-) Transcript_100456:72-866(-)